MSRRIFADLRSDLEKALDRIRRQHVGTSRPHRNCGLEYEFHLADGSGVPKGVAPDVLSLWDQTPLERRGPVGLCPEVLSSNGELNLPPVHWQAGGCETIAKLLKDTLGLVGNLAEQCEANVLLCGLQPLQGVQPVPENLFTVHPRYRDLEANLAQALGDSVQRTIFFPMDPPIRLPGRRLWDEGMNASVQFHREMNPSEIGREVNLIHALMGPLLALFANSGVLAGQLSWPVSRLTIWKQCVSPWNPDRDLHFLGSYLPEDDTAWKVWLERILSHKRESFIGIEAGDPLDVLTSYLSTFWWQVRPVFGVSPKPHIRAEIRPFCQQMTVADTISLMAILFGLLDYSSFDGNFRAGNLVSARQAKENFETAQKLGLGSSDKPTLMCWRNRKVDVCTICSELIQLAEIGLRKIGFNDEELNSSLTPARETLASQMNGARWLQDSWSNFKSSGLAPNEIAAKVVGYMIAQNKQVSVPSVGEWRVLC